MVCIHKIDFLSQLMTLVFYLIFAALALVLILKLVSLLIAEKLPLSREELSAYECGFEHHRVSRIPFSLRYFFLTLLFLLFDLEIVLMLFMPYVIFSSCFVLRVLILLLLVGFLFASLIYE